MTDPRLDAVLQPALGRIRTAVSAVLDQVSMQLEHVASVSTSNLQRQMLMTADRELRLKIAKVKQNLERELGTLSAQPPQKHADTRRNSLSETDWDTLSLVDNAQLELDFVKAQTRPGVAGNFSVRNSAAYADDHGGKQSSWLLVMTEL